MTNAVIRLAQTEEDFAAARALSYEWARTHLEEFPQYHDIILKVFAPDKYKETVENLHVIHARPQGAILLAELDGEPVGCVMYHSSGPQTAEIKRLFVDEKGRGYGLGQALLLAMFKQMQDDGYKRVIFSSAKILTHARTLYKSVGFADMIHPDDFPKEMRHFVYFMEREL